MDETLAYTTYKQWQLIALPALVLILGTIGELFVPTLPLGIPRREFGVYSWLALFKSQARIVVFSVRWLTYSCHSGIAI